MTRALVTGATSGIGRAIATALREAGHEVVAVGRNRQALDELGRGGIRGVAVDLSDRRATEAALAGFEPDILVNNAGLVPPPGPFCDADPDDLDRAVALNLSSVIGLTRLLAPGMRARERGHIFFTGSVAGHAPVSNLAVYGATKAAVGAFGQALRLELAPHGVRVTEIVAGRVETGLYRNLLPADAIAGMYAVPVVQPEDVAAMVLAVLALPASVNVSRFDILPTRPTPPVGTRAKDR